ncbi:outer membrane beta-barrel protein [Nonlabens ulvanivorans]|uniref:outer membrane beta-barrel protein n=1 Tax=Nonlabens ulvanivorans TaxID=906888 RepID=UPI002942290D|nr:outer membrane beta-barrel protein [Nonlabens ulvanivorans]WOI22725.1 outer membrane beta-barrel protein [Nonlabens ulvanivorans]
MKRLILTVIAILAMAFVHAQRFEIKGIVKDSTNQELLQSATVFLESKTDSTLISYSITDENGFFKLVGNTAVKEFNFFTSFTGYKEYNKIITFENGTIIDLGTINLSNDVEFLEGIVVNARKAPVTVKQDTLEFNAKSFNTKADANLEDVIKELPGVEIDKDGKITVNGKEVTKILVNGKEFFGDDPQVALKNLPKEIIDKIQVTESKTDEQKANGEAGDANASEINITIDEDKNRGWFSRLTAGAGTDDRYSMSGIVNYFKDSFRVSVLGSSNNINSPGFSFDEIYDAMGNSAYSISRNSNGSFGINGISFGGSGGITSSRSAGLSLANDWDEKVELTGSYFYGNNDTETQTNNRTTTFLPDREFMTTSSSRGRSMGDSHRINTRVEVKLDTLTTISIEPSYNQSSNNSLSNRISNTQDDTGQEIDIETSNNSNSDNYTAGANLYFSRRFKKKGNSISLFTTINVNDSESINDFFSERVISDNGVIDETEIQNQIINQESKGTNFSITPTWRKSLSDDYRLNISYRVSANRQEQSRNVFDRDMVTGEATIFNDALSNDFETDNTQQRPSVGLSYNKDKTRWEITAGLLYQTLNTDNVALDSSFDRSFSNPYIRAYLSKQFGKFGRIYFNYSNNINVPSVNQLQPVEDSTNPQNIIKGNPDLEATNTHNIYLNFNNYNWEEGKGIYSGAGFTYTNNQVAATTTTDDNLVRTTTYTNVDGTYNGYLYSGYSMQFKKDERSIDVSLGLDANLSLNKGFTNGVSFETNNVNLSPNVSFEYSIDDIFELETEYNISFNSSKFSLDNIDDQSFTNHTAAIDLTTFWPKSLIMGLRGEYNVFGNVTEEFDNDSFVLIGSLGYKFAKDKAVVKLKAYDILNQVIDTRRTISQDFISDSSSLVLRQYFMLSFTYKFSKFGGKDPNRE